MNTYGKNNENKKYIFKEGSNPLFPISNKTPNSLNYYSAIKLNIKSDLKKHKKITSNDIISNFQNKKMIENSSAVKNIREINKTYSSSRAKEDKQIIKLNNSKLSKIRPLDFSSNINDSGIIEKFNNNNNYHKKSLLSANKVRNKSNINLEMTSRDYRNNLNIISCKNLGNSQILNNNNNAFSLKKTNINKNIIDINSSNNNSYYNNIIINNNSSSNINSNPNLINQKRTNNNYYLKTDTNIRGNKTPKESNVKLIFTNKNIFGKKLEEQPIILKRKDSSSLPLTNTNTGNDLKISIDKNIFNGEYKLHLKKPKRNVSNENNIINMNLNNYINIKEEKAEMKRKRNKLNGPEDLHFYYISFIQEGKLREKEFEKD